MAVQFSRGCPFQCEFCDIIVLYGRKPRTKTTEQLLKELEYLVQLGWSRQIFIVDDNFIGNKRNVKLLLKELKDFIPSRAITEIVQEYIQAFWNLYEPENYLERTYRCFAKLGKPKVKISSGIDWVELRVLLIVMWRQGLQRSTRWKFWSYLWSILKNNFSVWSDYLIVCASYEHFWEYRQVVPEQLETQLQQIQKMEKQF